MAGRNTRKSGPSARAALAQLGWFDDQRRLVALRLSEPQWQTFQQAVLQAAAEGSTAAAAEDLLTICLRQWLEERG
jgi:hypothetical protein